MRSRWRVADRELEIDLVEDGDRLVVRSGEAEFVFDTVESEPGYLVVTTEGTRLRVPLARRGAHMLLGLDGEAWEVVPAEEAAEEAGETGAFTPEITAPMPGKVLEVLVAVGDTVDAEGPLLVLEAMKMEQTVRAVAAARVVSVAAVAGAMVGPGDLLLVLEAIEDETGASED
jgi:3-methylcrotonyl-CoA carboxylase alpha subunit